jgi:hypothetical protein
MGLLRQIRPQILYASYFSRDPVGAKGYLLGKYDLHDCSGDPRETSAASRVAASGPVKTSKRLVHNSLLFRPHPLKLLAPGRHLTQIGRGISQVCPP